MLQGLDACKLDVRLLVCVGTFLHPNKYNSSCVQKFLENVWFSCHHCPAYITFNFMSQCLKFNSCLTDYKASQRNEDAHPVKEWVESGDIVFGCKICGLCKTDSSLLLPRIPSSHTTEVSPVQICKCLGEVVLDFGVLVEGILNGLGVCN